MKYRSGYKYQLVEAERFFIPELVSRLPFNDKFIHLSAGILILEEGYAWDGPSGPTIDTNSSMRGSAGHDGLYQLIRAGHLTIEDRKLSDECMREWFLEDGMWGWRASAWFRSVRWFGLEAATAEPKEIKDTMI